MPNEIKIKGLGKLADLCRQARDRGERVVHTHGVFDLLHIGHIKHLEESRRAGDLLVVTLIPDRHVNKGPYLPHFSESLRLETLAALQCVNAVALSEDYNLSALLEYLKPAVYSRGRMGKYHDFLADSEQKTASVLAAHGIETIETDKMHLSTTSLINRYMDVFTPEAKDFLGRFRRRYTIDAMADKIGKLRALRVLVIGETILDEYQFCHALNRANKDPILAVQLLGGEMYAGGALAVANHLAGFCGSVGILSILGADDPHEKFVEEHLTDNVNRHFFHKNDYPTIIKRRFVEEYLGQKMFEVYIMKNEGMSEAEEAEVMDLLHRSVSGYDVVLVADYGHGMMSPAIVQAVCKLPKFLAVNAQTNAANRGFNCVSKYPRADYVCVDEAEARLEVRKRAANVSDVASEIQQRMHCARIMITRGKRGCLCLDAKEGEVTVPALAVKVVDRIGAGDALLAVSACCTAGGFDAELTAFFGNVAGAEACAIMGNRQPICPDSFMRHVTSLLR